MRERDVCRSSRACALATASETRSQKAASRTSAFAGSVSAPLIVTAPQSVPATMIGAATVER